MLRFIQKLDLLPSFWTTTQRPSPRQLHRSQSPPPHTSKNNRSSKRDVPQEILHYTSHRRRAHKQPHASPPQGIAFVVVYGFLCNMDQERLQKEKRYFMKHAHPSITDVDVMCDNRTARVAGNIFSQTIRNTMKHDNLFQQAVHDRIAYYLQRKQKVIVVGHSYGGSIVSRLAHHFRGERDLKMFTFGSIHLPRDPLLKHHMYKHDIAFVCHKSRPHVCEHVTWLPPRKRAGPLAQHMDYWSLILALAENGYEFE